MESELKGINQVFTRVQEKGGVLHMKEMSKEVGPTIKVQSRRKEEITGPNL